MKIKVLFVALFLSSFLSWGQSIFTNPITGANPEASNPFTTGQTIDPNITVSGIGRGSGIVSNAGTNRYNASGWNSAALDGNDYFEFTLTPNAGYRIDFTNFVYTAQASASGATAFAFRSSVDGYTSTIGAATGTGATLDLTGVAYQNITTAITFRFYGWAASLSTGTFSINDFTFNGTVTPSCVSPTTQATLFTSAAIAATTATVGWTRGNGNAVLVVAHSGVAVNTDPTSGTTYTASTVFGAGSQIGTGNFVVYNGTGTFVNLTGLVSGTTYYFAVYEYNSASTCYNLTELTGSFTTLVVPPTITLANNGTQVTAANVPQATTDLILHKLQLTVSNANANLIGIANVVTTGTYLATDILNLKVRYSVDNVLDATDATLSTFTNPGVAGLKTFPGFVAQFIPAGTVGYIFITTDVAATATIGNTIALNAVANANFIYSSSIKTGSTNIGGVQTFSPSPPAVPTNFTKGCTTNTTQVLNWAAPATGTFDGYILVVREAATPNAITSIVAATQPFNLDYTLAPTYAATTSRVLYIGTGTSVTVTGLTQGINYTFALYSYKNNGASTTFSSTAVTTSQTMGLPTVSSAVGTNGNASGTLTWANPTALCYDQILIVATAASGITFVPTGSTTTAYPSTGVFSGFDQAVYYSSGNFVSISGLTNGVTYYFEIFVRNGSQWSTGVEVSITPVNIVPTVLKTGDLLLIAYNNNSGGADDAIRLLTLVDINPGTKFIWANTTYETGGNPAANVRTDKWFTCDVVPTGNLPYLEFTYTGTTPIPAASTFCITTVSAGTASTITAVSPAGVAFPNTVFTIVGKSADGTVLASHGAVNVSTSNPDSMFLMQGNFTYAATGSTFTGTVLSAIQDGGLWYDLPDDLTAVTGTNYRRSRKHPQLLCASIQGNLTPASYQVSYNVSTTTYTLGNRPYLLGSILNYTINWVTTFGTCPSASPFVITASDPFNRWTGNVSTNWFDCNNWALLSVPDELTDVSVLASAARDAVIDYTAPYSDGFLDIAKCKTITISGKKVQIEANTNNVLEVHENLILDTTGVLDMDDANAATADGQIYLTGNWTNSIGNTAFLEGNGTLHFIGSTPQIINANVHTNPEQFYNVILDNDFNTAICNNIIATGNLELKTNKILSVASNDYIQVNKKLTNNGDITIANNGQLIQVDEIDTNDGDYSGTKFLINRTAQAKHLDYVYWSAPTENFGITSLPTNNRFEWNTLFANTNGTLGNWVAPSTATMTKGRGYIARASNGASTPTALNTPFVGKPNNGQFTYPIYRGNYTGPDYDADLTNPNNIFTTALDDNWNLVGNPYPSAIDAEEFLVQNQASIEGAVWVWKHGLDPTSSVNPFYANFIYNYSSSDYIKYNGLGSTEPDTFAGKIASGQGFMINMKDAAVSGTTIAFTNDMRSGISNAVYNNADFFKNSATAVGATLEEKHRIWLDIINATSGQMDRTLVGYSTNSTMEKDNLYDCVFRPRSEVSLYSLIDNNPFIIQGRALPFNQDDRVPMGIKIVNAGLHTIAIKKVDGLFNQDQDIYLEDNLTHVIHNLKQAPYSFTSEIGTFDDRFVLRYTNATLTNTQTSLIENNVVVTVKNGQVGIRSNYEKITSVEVFDVLGRSVTKKENTSDFEIQLTSISSRNQALVIKIQLENGATVSRKIVL